MTDVLLIAGAIPTRPKVLVDALTRLRDGGARVYLACDFDPARLDVPEDVAETRNVAGDGSAGRVLRQLAGRAAKPVGVWMRAHRDPWVRRHARSAEIIVALDNNAVHTVWQLAARNRSADAVFGLVPALNALDARRARPARPAGRAVLPSPRVLAGDAVRRAGAAARLAGMAATGRRAMRVGPVRGLLAAATSAPGIPERRRSALALRLQTSMINAGQPGSAMAMAKRVVPRVADPSTRAALLGPAADSDLAAGRTPPSLRVVVEGELARAAERARTHPGQALPIIGRAFDLLFHRVLHYDGLSSPLSEDPEGFLAPLHESAIGRLLAAPAGRTAPARAPGGRPPRLLFLTGLNDNFLTPIRERYEAMPEVEVRRLDMSPGTPVRAFLNNGRAKLIAHRLAGSSSRYGLEAERLFGPDLAWADTVFVDWCAAPAGLLSLADPGTARVVVRLHSFEAFTWWPHLVDFSRVDDVVFVSEHLRDLAVAAVPRLRSPGAPRLHVLTNAMDLRRYSAEKTPEARFTLGLVGISAIAKDPRWAIEVLRELRRHDERYNLVLVGKEPSPDVSAASKSYCEALDRDVAELEALGAVRRLGQRDDIPKVLTEVGVILSSSVREGSPCSMAEGAASGAVPVVRDWPFFAGGAHGARTVFPDGWVVSTPAEAAERIRKLTASDEVWRAAGQAAADHALATWGWDVVAPTYDTLFLPDGR